MRLIGRKAEEEPNRLPNPFGPRDRRRGVQPGPKVIPGEIGAFTTEISHVNLLTAPSPQPDKVYDSGELGKVSEGGGVDGRIDVPRLFMSWT